MDFKNILYKNIETLALITINRPESHNSISLDTLDELNNAVDLAASDENINHSKERFSFEIKLSWHSR